MSSRWYTLVIDAKDPARLARWWAQVLEYELVEEGPDEVVIVQDEDTNPGIIFVPATEEKTGKNRLHLDLNPDDQDAEVERLVNLGAARVDIGQRDVRWVVLADPEGNEFCVLTAREQ